MTHERNKAIARGYLDEVVDKGNLGVIDTYFSQDVVLNGSIDFEGLKGFLARRKAINGTAFPDLHLTIDDQIAERDQVVTRVTFRGTHQGEYNGIAPTGRAIEFSSMAIDRIADGKVVEMWHIVNLQALLQQIGAVPLPAPRSIQGRD